MPTLECGRHSTRGDHADLLASLVDYSRSADGDTLSTISKATSLRAKPLSLLLEQSLTTYEVGLLSVSLVIQLRPPSASCADRRYRFAIEAEASLQAERITSHQDQLA